MHKAACIIAAGMCKEGARGDWVSPQLLDAIRSVESSGDNEAVGDDGEAVGPYQIHRAYWQDGTEHLGVDWPVTDRTDPVRSRSVVRAYFNRYGRGLDNRGLARLHNGGPKWRNKASTEEYADKVMSRMRGPGYARTAAAQPETGAQPAAGPAGMNAFKRYDTITIGKGETPWTHRNNIRGADWNEKMKLLRNLNPGVDFNNIKPGTQLKTWGYYE